MGKILEDWGSPPTHKHRGRVCIPTVSQALQVRKLTLKIADLAFRIECVVRATAQNSSENSRQSTQTHSQPKLKERFGFSIKKNAAVQLPFFFFF